ncbi:winged helix-turn-helix domain-containing protein [Bradyrhizobium cenepequi]
MSLADLSNATAQERTGQERSEPVYRLVVRSIEAKIMSGEWAVGDRVPAETALAAGFGVHRSTVREAIRVLEQHGLVRRHDGGKLLYTRHRVSPDHRPRLAQPRSAAQPRADEPIVLSGFP